MQKQNQKKNTGVKRTKYSKCENEHKTLSQRDKMKALQNQDIAVSNGTQYTLHVEQILFLSDITWIQIRLRMTLMAI